MISLRNVLLFVGFVVLLFFGVPVDIGSLSDEEVQFRRFIERYNKSYDNNTDYRQRFETFKHTLRRINELNELRKSNASARYGVTKYSDLTAEEFLGRHLQRDYSRRLHLKAKHSGERHRNKRSNKLYYKSLNVPSKVDWRAKGVVTSINDQYTCGACWAFSAVEVVESMQAIRTGNLTKLSTQQLIDCAGYSNDGCNGGDVCTLLEWLRDEGVAIRRDSEYPMHWRNERCKAGNSSEGVRVKDFACDYLAGNEEMILTYLARRGPVAAAINAVLWQNYVGGVVQYHCSSNALLMNHAVQIVGYDLDAKIPHYIVRNSWGEDFGDDGYLYIAIGKNVCGLANEVSAIELAS